MTEEIYGFAEMAVMKVGPLLDLPKAARIQLMRAERTKAKAQQVDAERARGQREADAAALQKLQRAEELAYDAALPLCMQWAEGRGEPKLVKRYARRKELQLLVMDAEALKLQVPTYEWRQFMTSGLQRAEVQALAYKLRQPGVRAALADAREAAELPKQRALAAAIAADDCDGVCALWNTWYGGKGLQSAT